MGYCWYMLHPSLSLYIYIYIYIYIIYVLGRSQEALEAIKNECIDLNPECKDLDIIIANSFDVKSMAAMVCVEIYTTFTYSSKTSILTPLFLCLYKSCAV